MTCRACFASGSASAADDKPLAVSAEQLAKDYKSDPAAADKKYKGRKPTARARAAEVLNGVRQASRRINLHDGKARPCFCRPVAHAIPP